MADNPQPGETGDLDQVQAYQKIVLEYEALDEEIDALKKLIQIDYRESGEQKKGSTDRTA